MDDPAAGTCEVQQAVGAAVSAPRAAIELLFVEAVLNGGELVNSADRSSSRHNMHTDQSATAEHPPY